MQMEALKRYRSGAEQKVTLQHVSVAEGAAQVKTNEWRSYATLG
jgi:hypothetical protein